MYSLTFLETRSPTRRCQKSRALSEALYGDLSGTFLAAGVSSSPWHSTASTCNSPVTRPSSPCMCSRSLPAVCICLCPEFIFVIKTTAILVKAYPNGLALTN